MTWIFGASAFNGFVCVADVQATFTFKDASRKPIFLNCIRKVHRVYKNLYVAFSGDIRIGLLIIEKLKRDMSENFKEGELFSIEGQLDILSLELKRLYDELVIDVVPDLELMFLWAFQEGRELRMQTGCIKFIAPDFRFNSTALLHIDQCGSGRHSKELKVVTEFIRGRGDSADPIYQELFGQVQDIPHVWTASKIRTLLVSEAARAVFEGVSRSYISVIGEHATDKTYSDIDHAMLSQLHREIGIREYVQPTRSDTLRTFSMDFDVINARIQAFKEVYPIRFAQLQEIFSGIKSREDTSVLSELPTFKETFHSAEGENVNFSKLCETWNQVRSLMRSRGMTPHACNAIA